MGRIRLKQSLMIKTLGWEDLSNQAERGKNHEIQKPLLETRTSSRCRKANWREGKYEEEEKKTQRGHRAADPKKKKKGSKPDASYLSLSSGTRCGREEHLRGEVTKGNAAWGRETGKSRWGRELKRDSKRSHHGVN